MVIFKKRLASSVDNVPVATHAAFGAVFYCLLPVSKHRSAGFFSRNIEAGRYSPAEKFFGLDMHDTGCRGRCYSGTYLRRRNCK